ncbi:hypothetical protein SUGI_0375130 [Cryptomeria japonica]|uniref:jacalin-related lectin 3 n=1 Tax=Cryptomeria japonica TaxID=3369 RepID=UPI002408EB0D|nr:jacalin-related lectin 3 [Cryptomeria japonica]GLJ20599.1 hypothetical protein SUGI_0375130 [Cryptomeria japonica]
MLRTVTDGVGRVPSKTSGEKSKCQAIIKDFADKPVAAGPWGGEGGLCWDDEVHAGIRQIIIKSGTAIDSIVIDYDDGGQAKRSVRHGGSGGPETDKITFDYPNEVLLSISGYYGPFYTNGPSAVRSLTFCTNLRKYGPYGVEQGTFFESSQLGSRIVGFHGRSGLFLDAIGVYNRLFINCCSGNKKCDASLLLPRVVSVVRDIVEAVKLTNPQENLKVSHLKPVPAGPWGGRGGNPWDDGIYSGIRQIVVGFGTAIDNIIVEYVRNGQSVWSARRGGNGGSRTETVKFDYPNEVLVSISGYYDTFGQSNALTVNSLTFHTNRRKYGPFGEEKGTYFTSPSTGSKILGFHGRSGWYLDAIGVHSVIEHPVDEGTGEEVKNAWAEFVSRAIHHKAGGGGI